MTNKSENITTILSSNNNTINSLNNMSTITTTTTTTAVINININQTFNNDNNNNIECYSTINSYDLFESLLCLLLILIGFVYLTCGYRCFKSVMFTTGFIFGTCVIYSICLSENLLPLYGNICVSLLAGLLFALITMLVCYVGLFMLGFHFGLLLSVHTLTIVYIETPIIVDIIGTPSSLWIIFAIFMFMGLCGACLTLYFQKGCTIIGSVLYGSSLIICCSDYFIENFKLIYWFRDKLRDGQYIHNNDGYDSDVMSSSVGVTRTTSLCTISYIVLAFWPLITLFGLCIQSFYTSKGICYENDYNYGIVTSSTTTTTTPSSGGHSNGRNSCGQLNLNRIRQQDNRNEQKQRKYRYLYQVRTAHGDVISQQYIQQCLHQNSKQQHNNSSDTFNSEDTFSHLTMIQQTSDSLTTTTSLA